MRPCRKKFPGRMKSKGEMDLLALMPLQPVATKASRAKARAAGKSGKALKTHLGNRREEAQRAQRKSTAGDVEAARCGERALPNRGEGRGTRGG